MPRQSATDNVRKICRCVKWKTCGHPWYLWAQRDGVRYRENLDLLIGRHVTDYQQARDEAQRALLAKLDGRDPKGLLPNDDPTVALILDQYLRKRPRADSQQAAWQVGVIVGIKVTTAQAGRRPLGACRASVVTTRMIEEFQRQRPVAAGNRDLALLRAAFNVAMLDGLVERSPFRVGHVNAVPMQREENRTRRLQPGEEEALVLHAPRLAALILAALESGCRQGELLSLQWHQVRFTPRAELFLPAQKTKAKKDRRIPISTVLRAVLEARRRDPAGEPLPPHAYVFGDAVGRRIGFSKRAWDRAVLLAHRHTPEYVQRTTRTPQGKILRLGPAQLTPASRAVLRAIDLHFHDLRREAGSRWMDAGIPLATIQRWLGHANIAQTSTYLGASIGGDEQDMRAYEAKVGRVAPLPEIASPASDTVGSGTPNASPGIENVRKNAIVH